MRPAKAQTSLEYSMTFKLLTEHHLEFLSLNRGFTGSSKSTHVRMPHCWISHVAAHIPYPRYCKTLMFGGKDNPENFHEFSNVILMGCFVMFSCV